MDIWGWIEPVWKLIGRAFSDRSRRRRLLAALENPRFPSGRTLEALRREIGEADTDEGRERTRKLLRGVRRDHRQARILDRSDPGAEEMWGLRPL